LPRTARPGEQLDRARLATDPEEIARAAGVDPDRVREWIDNAGEWLRSLSGGGPGPQDALGLVRELRDRDWIDADGVVTLVGRHALGRWLAAAEQR
jgi:hypothetical protein